MQPAQEDDGLWIGSIIASVSGGISFFLFSDPDREFFRPMNISSGLIPAYFEESGQKVGKDATRTALSERSLASCVELAGGELSVE